MSFRSTIASVAAVSPAGLVSAQSAGTAVLLASSHGIQAATAITVGPPADLDQQLLSEIGLTADPPALALAGQRRDAIN